jgi:hypothetical protein
MLEIKTNNIPRDILDGSELTLAEREEFAYLDWQAIDSGTDSASFFRYKGETYDLGEFSRDFGPFPTWDGYLSDSFFSGILVKYVENFERVIVGRYLS